MRDTRYEHIKDKTRIILISFVLLCLLAAATCVFAGESKSAEKFDSATTAVVTEPAPIIEEACSEICKGDFAAARQLLEESSESENTAITQLTNIISEYEAIEQRRRSAREAAYAEQLAELAQHQKSFGSRRFGAGRAGADANDVNDVNDANNLTEVLAVIAKAGEFAEQKQKEQLLSDVFVKLTFQQAVDKAAEFEAKGKWLDAYISCYSWLQAIDPENEAYSDYADQLLTKANIVASFQDSPCETREERFEGVQKEMFVRAIDALQFNYVSIIDYRQMATKAIRRCELLAEVMALSFDQIAQSESLVSSGEVSEGVPKESFLPPDSKKLAAWSAALAAILDEINQLAIGVSKDKFIDILEKVLALNTTTVQLPRQVLIAQFAEAALFALDRYTVMVWPRQVQDFEKQMTNEFTGIGIEISREKGLLTVASLLPDTPAYNSGLDAGDVIEAVDGVPTKDMTLTCAVRKITGPAGTKVRLTIRHPPTASLLRSKTAGEKTSDITITRAKITVPTIRGWQRTEQGRWLYMIDDANGIGYVRITSFSAETTPDLEKVLNELEAEGLKGLILDLRSNSGGLLDVAIKVTDKFLEEGPIVITRPRSWVSSTYASAHKEKTHPNYPLVVLINRISASASEIVAGALADEVHNRTTLVGGRTHGKGSVQGITPYPDGGAQLKYTMAHYHLPSGQRVESRDAMKKLGRTDWGVGPNVEVKLTSDELRKMIDVQRDNDVLVKADHDPCVPGLKKHTIEETLATNPQLAIGVLVLKAKLIQEEAKSVNRKAVELKMSLLQKQEFNGF